MSTSHETEVLSSSQIPHKIEETWQARQRGRMALKTHLLKLSHHVQRLSSTIPIPPPPLLPGEKKVPYYLIQPKPKASNYLKAKDIIILETGGEWKKAQLISRLKEYVSIGYKWKFNLLENGEKREMLLASKGQWGLVAGEDLELDFTRLEPQLSIHPRRARYRLMSECEVCQKTNMSIYPEERSQLQSFIPFTCKHQKEISGLEAERGNTEEQAQIFTVTEIPRPKGWPRNQESMRPVRSVGESTSSSRWDAPKITMELEKLDDMVTVLTGQHAELDMQIMHVLPDMLTAHPWLNAVNMAAWLKVMVDEVETAKTEAENILYVLQDLEGPSAPEWTRADVNPPSRGRSESVEELFIEDDLSMANQVGAADVEETRPVTVSLDPGQKEVALKAAYQGLMSSLHNGEVDRSRREDRQGETSRNLLQQEVEREDVRLPPIEEESLAEGLPILSSRRGEESNGAVLHISDGLKREKRRLEDDWAHFCNQMPAVATPSCTQGQAVLMNKRMEDIDTRLRVVVKGYDEEEAKIAPVALAQVKLEKESLWERISGGLRQATAQVIGGVHDPIVRHEPQVIATNRRGISRLERIALPRFSGKLEEYHDFKRIFKGLTVAEDLPECFMLTQLRDRLPKEAVELLAGVTEVGIAWKHLDRRYGNRDQAIMQAKHRLRHAKVGTGAAFEQLENLRIAVQTASAHLEAVGAKEELFVDASIFGTLISKIPFAYQERWHLLSTDSSTQDEGESTGVRFVRWLEREGEAANAARLVRIGNAYMKEDGGSVRSSGAQGGARIRDPSTLGSFQADSFAAEGRPWREPIRSREHAQEVKESLVKRATGCPVCQKTHSYERKFTWGTIPWPSQRLEACPMFLALTPMARAKKVEDEGGCCLCTAWNHVVTRCFLTQNNRPGNPDIRCKEGTANGVCNKQHHRLLHGSGNAYCQANLAVAIEVIEVEATSLFTNVDLVDLTRRCLFEHVLAPVRAKDGHVQEEIVLTDSAANTNFITHDLAQELGAVGRTVEYSLKVVDSQYRRRSTLAYEVAVIDVEGKEHWVYALGVEVITDANPPPSLKEARKVFPEAHPDVFRRPVGPVRLLLSMTERHLHSRGGEEKGSLRLAPTPLGCGWILTGLLPLPGHPLPQWSNEVRSMMGRSADPPLESTTFLIESMGLPKMGFQEAEEMGYSPPPMCQGCKECRECEGRRTKMSKEEREVFEQVEREMVLIPEEQILQGRYPWKPCAEKMRDNLHQVTKIQAAIEKRQIRDGKHVSYNEEFRKMVERGALRLLSEEEMCSWKGPVNYNTLFSVSKDDSVSSKTRIVSNSAQKNIHSGLSLNDCMYQGPDCLSSLLDVLLHWRIVESSIIMDLHKAYQAIHTGNGLELHLRRVLGREGVEEKWKIYAFTRATFGDLAAGLLLEVAKRKAAEKGHHIDPMAARQLVRFTYVDDSLAGGSEEDVDRMLGKKEEGKYNGTMSQILQTCGLQAKFMAKTGDQDLEAGVPIGGKVLGIGYDLAKDEIQMSVPTGPLDPACKEDKNPGLLTKRKVLSFIMSAFDPLGLLCPVLLEGKVMLRELYGPGEIGWDDPLAPSQQLKWKRWVSRLQRDPTAFFPRSTRPKGAIGQPKLVGFSDASMTATCAVIYVVWNQEGTSQKRAQLLVAKSRVTPLHGMTIPRAELQALVILLRILVTVLKATEATFSQACVATDSQCVLAALQKPAQQMKPYFANRVAEVWALIEEAKTLCKDVESPLFVPGVHNPADLGTREGVTMSDVKGGTPWQQGPAFLRLSRDQWPIRKEGEGVVPEEELRKKYVNVAALASIIDARGGGLDVRAAARDLVLRCTSWRVAQGALALVIRAACCKDRNQIHPSITEKEREAAKMICIWAHSDSAREAMEKGKLLSLGARKKGGLVVIDGRVRKEDLARLLGISEIPLIMPQEPLARMVLTDAHREDHNRDTQYVIVRARRELWIPSANKVAKAVARGCMGCRVRNKKMESQLMGQMPSERTKVAAPFQVAALDMFGPFWVKDVAMGRRRFKTWAVMYCCLATKAVAIFTCPGYSTEVFLLTHAKFVAIYTPGSQPTKMYCDHGPQLLAAATSINWEKVRWEAGCQRTEWVFTPKACSWRNGVAERSIRSARHTLLHSINTGALLDLHQLDTLFHQVAAIMNGRPIAVRVGAANQFHSISPSDILLGRSARKYVDPVDLEPWEEDDQVIIKVASKQQKILEAWWKAWFQQSFQDMVPRTKWTQEHRSVQVGDICHMIYHNQKGSPHFRLGRIVATSPDDRGQVRSCSVELHHHDKRNDGRPTLNRPIKTVVETAVQRLAILLPVEEQNGSQDHLE